MQKTICFSLLGFVLLNMYAMEKQKILNMEKVRDDKVLDQEYPQDIEKIEEIDKLDINQLIIRRFKVKEAMGQIYGQAVLTGRGLSEVETKPSIYWYLKVELNYLEKRKDERERMAYIKSVKKAEDSKSTEN